MAQFKIKTIYTHVKNKNKKNISTRMSVGINNVELMSTLIRFIVIFYTYAPTNILLPKHQILIN